LVCHHRGGRPSPRGRHPLSPGGLSESERQPEVMAQDQRCVCCRRCLRGCIPRALYIPRPKHEASPPPPSSALTWNDHDRTPKPNSITHGHANANIPVLAWQYYGDYPKKWVLATNTQSEATSTLIW
jgi:hypothetical protein